jgi:hypothetical protein
LDIASPVIKQPHSWQRRWGGLSSGWCWFGSGSHGVWMVSEAEGQQNDQIQQSSETMTGSEPKPAAQQTKPPSL